MQIMKLSGHWNFMNATTWKTPGFETNDLGYMRQSDEILSVLWAGYNQWEPKWIYRNYNINFDVFSFWNFGGFNIGKGFELNANMGLKNFWNVWTGGSINSNNLDQNILRGGPMMKTPGTINSRFGFSSDNRKKLEFNVYTNYTFGLQRNSRNFHSGIEISYKPTNYLSVTFNPGLTKSYSELQYITTTNIDNKDKFIFGSIDRKTISASFRVNLNLSPNLTIQYWGQPFVATGKYYDHKIIIDPSAGTYSNRFSTYSEGQINLAGDQYNVDENTDGTTDYNFDNTDFNVQEFLSNLVVRWEYNPGSSVYLVWSQTRSNSTGSGNMDLLNDLGDLFDTGNNKPHNVFLIKFSYRFGLK